MSTPLIDLVGFDYAQAILELNQRYTYAEIAGAMGYSHKTSVLRIAGGSVPSHKHGEALWAFYCATFNSKPKFSTPKATRAPLRSPP